MEPLTPTQHVSSPVHFEFEVSAERAGVWADLQLSNASVERLEHLGTHDDTTLLRIVELEAELRCRIESDGPAGGLRCFVATAADFADAADRHSVINLVELVEGRRRGSGQRTNLPPLAWPGWIDPADPHRCKRVLTDIEHAGLRYTATRMRAGSKILVALGEASATIDEATAVTPLCIDLHRFEAALPGGERFDARTGSIPLWARDTVKQVVEACWAMSDRILEKRLVYSGKKDDQRDAQKAVSMAARKVFMTAGLGGPNSAVSFESLRNTTGRRMADAGCSTDDVAAFLGLRSLDQTRTRIGLNPAPPPRDRSTTD